MLIANGITKSFGDQQVLRGVSLSIEKGKICALIGPSGSGKTTLLKVLAFLEQPDSGSVTIDDVSYQFPLAKSQKIQPPWPKVTVVFQQLFLWPHLTLLQNITLPLSAQGRDDNPARLQELLKIFDMNHFVYRYPNEASLGQRQRAALVRALLLEPEYLLLDEITSSLDIEQTAIILSQLKKLSSQGIGILTITHLLQFAQDAADKVAFMADGQILEEGSPELLAHPQSERLSQFLSVVKAVS
jgi:ABC-type polar amino acid transport system ATPase subunit